VWTEYCIARPDTSVQLKDNLGSTVADVDSAGNVIGRYSFDTFGKVRNPNGSATGGTVSESRRGFTGHEHVLVGNSGVIHMNGRTYDATLGRFAQPDPTVQAPDFSQSYNRYSYLFNSPLGGTDPTGFRSLHFEEYFQIVWVAAATYITWGASTTYFGGLTTAGSGYTTAALSPTAVAALSGAVSGAAGAFAGSLVSTDGDISASLKSAAYGAVSGAIGGAGFSLVGTYASFASNPIGNVMGHALVGCVQSSAQGGKCGTGAISGAVGAVASGIGGSLELGKYGNGVLTTVAGGVAANLGGGSFEEGASIALFGYLFNELQHINQFDVGNDAHDQLQAHVLSLDPTNIKIEPWSVGSAGNKTYFGGFPDIVRTDDPALWEIKSMNYARMAIVKAEYYSIVSKATGVEFVPGGKSYIFGSQDTLTLNGKYGRYTYTYAGPGAITYSSKLYPQYNYQPLGVRMQAPSSSGASVRFAF
jgi:RHS repeat-associated protein